MLGYLRQLSWLIAGAALLSLAGCAANSTNAATAPPNAGIVTGSTDAAAGAGTTVENSAIGAARRGVGNTIRIAMLLPLSGAAGTAEVAKGLRQAGELALIEFDNPNIILSTKDTRGTAEGAKTAAEDAVREGVEIILGPIFAKEVAAVSPVARNASVPVIAFSSDQSVAGNGTYLLSFLAGQDVARIVTHATANGRRSFAALIPEGPYGRVLETAFREAVQTAGARVAALQTYPANANGMLEPVQRIKEAIDQASTSGARIDALFMPAGQDTLPTLAPLLPYNGIDPKTVKLLGSSDWDYSNIGREQALEGGWYPAPDPKGWNDFVQRYTGAYNVMPPRLASVAYDAVSLVVSLSNGAAGQRFSDANLTRPTGFAGIDGLFRLKDNGRLERGLAVLEVTKYGTSVADPAPTSFGPGAVTAAASGASAAQPQSSGGLTSMLPRLNFWSAQQ